MKKLYNFETFIEWPLSGEGKPMELAAAGFSFTGKEDIVECSVCKLKLGGWISIYNPKEKHRLKSPNCPIAKSLSTKTLERGFTESTDSSQNLASSTVDGKIPKSKSQKQDYNGDLDMTYREARLGTYKGWVSTFIPISELVDAGFFFTGIGDRTQCAFCDIVLKRWKIGDIPMREHQRESPDCLYVRGIVKNSEKV